MQSTDHKLQALRFPPGPVAFFGGLVALVVVVTGTHVSLNAAERVRIRGHFKGTTTVEADPASTPGKPLFRLTNRARGNLSHLGRTVADWKVHAVSLDMANGQIFVQRPNWTGTLKAANGDEIRGEYQFPSQRLSISSVGNVTFEAHLRVVGGTGRFANASGTAVSVGVANVLTGNFAIEMKGEITTVGRRRN